MNPAYISALAALARSIIGGLTSLATSWLTQSTHARAGQLARDKRRREKLYGKFIDEASSLSINALGVTRRKRPSKPPSWLKSTL